MHLIRVAQRPTTAWRNGGGRTRVMAQGPPTAGPDDVAWRLSVAEVERPGPFSAFPGLHRQLIVAGEEPLTLVIDGSRSRLGPGSVVAFDGAASVSCELTGGPVTAVNVMTRPATVTAQVAFADADPELACTAPIDGCLFLVALTDRTTWGRHGQALEPRDVIWLEAGEQERVSGGRIALIRLHYLT